MCGTANFTIVVLTRDEFNKIGHITLVKKLKKGFTYIVLPQFWRHIRTVVCECEGILFYEHEDRMLQEKMFKFEVKPGVYILD